MTSLAAADVYQGKAGRMRLVSALERQHILCGDSVAVALIADAARIEVYQPGKPIISQDGDGDDLFFILEGEAHVCAQKRIIRVRAARTHFGDMAMIDPEGRRSADVIAVSQVIVARVEGARAREIADRPDTNLWRALARALADRLREHTAAVRQKNVVPVIFIGSTREALPVALALKRAFAGNWATVMVWNDPGFFPASLTAIESLEQRVQEIDFAVLVAGDDDVTTSRGARLVSPRDNIIFEAGLAMGAIGRARTIVVTPDLGSEQLKWPSDLLGLNVAMFDPPPQPPKPFRSRRAGASYDHLGDTDMDALIADRARILVAQMKLAGTY